MKQLPQITEDDVKIKYLYEVPLCSFSSYEVYHIMLFGGTSAKFNPPPLENSGFTPDSVFFLIKKKISIVSSLW